MLRLRHVVRPTGVDVRYVSISVPAGAAKNPFDPEYHLREKDPTQKGPYNAEDILKNKYNIQGVNPIRRTVDILRNDLKRDFKRIRNFLSWGEREQPNLKGFIGDTESGDVFQTHCDVLVIGGGAIGSSVAYWLKYKARTGLNVVVVEKDNTYKHSSSTLSVGGLRQQFTLPENVMMSLYGADFIRQSKELIGDVPINFTPHGYLMLASEQGADTLRRSSLMQNELGARNELLTPTRLKAKFPWLNTDGIELGCHGLEKEGWFDPWALLAGFKSTAMELGAHYIDAEVVDFTYRPIHDIMIAGAPETAKGAYNALDQAVVKLKNGEHRTIKFAICVLAAGAQSGAIARLAGIGKGTGMMCIPLPVEPRKRYVYVFNTQGVDAPGFGTPLTVDPDGTYFRRDGLGGNYICGRSPARSEEPSCDNLDVDHEFFDTNIWPTLAHRVKAFESLKVVNSWAGFYEQNLYDENGIIGPHPYYGNMIMATGFSGHGIQQAPAVGRAISELIMDSQYRTIDLSRFSFDRLIADVPIEEENIV